MTTPRLPNSERSFCSWSGGKDSCLALYRDMQDGDKPEYLLTVLDETGMRSHSHGLPRSLIEMQAQRLDMQVLFRSATWDEYETAFISGLLELKRNGIHRGIFGDIDLESNRDWVQRVCDMTTITPVHPLWQVDRRQLLEEFVNLGFKAMIVVVNATKLDKRFLGETISLEIIDEMVEAGIDPSGEFGEYHTIVTDGPIFSSTVPARTKGVRQFDGYWFLELESQ